MGLVGRRHKALYVKGVGSIMRMDDREGIDPFGDGLHLQRSERRCFLSLAEGTLTHNAALAVATKPTTGLFTITVSLSLSLHNFSKV